MGPPAGDSEFTPLSLKLFILFVHFPVSPQKCAREDGGL